MQNSLADGERVFPIIDRLFIAFIILEIAIWPLLPFGPLAVALLAQFTRVPSSRTRTVVLWVGAGILTLLVIAPFVARSFALHTMESPPR